METSSICISMPSCRKITSKKLITLGLKQMVAHASTRNFKGRDHAVLHLLEQLAFRAFSLPLARQFADLG